MNTAIIYRLLGMGLIALSGAFTVCILVGTLSGEALSDPSIQAFMVSIVVSMVSAGVLLQRGKSGSDKLFRREA